MLKILITGGEGFIGSHLADSLTREGHEVIKYDLKSDKDILDYSELRKASSGVDGIIHFAAMQRVITGFQKPFLAIEVNIMGLHNVLKVALENDAFVIFGSSKTVYGKPNKLPVRESDPKNPTNIYSLTKLFSEKIVEDFCRNYSLRAAVVRFSTVFGSERDILDRAIPTWMYKALTNTDLVVEDPDRAIDPVFIDDIIPVLHKLTVKLSKSEGGSYDDYNLVSYNPVKVGDLVQDILKLSKSSAKVIGYVKPRSYDYGSCYGDFSKIRTEFGYKPTELDRALRVYISRFERALKENRFSESEIKDMLAYYKDKEVEYLPK